MSDLCSVVPSACGGHHVVNVKSVSVNELRVLVVRHNMLRNQFLSGRSRMNLSS
jgi:hypothetical protein